MINTRFAPSPTGYLHIGNIRTAFFCWLFARKNKGNFYLRIDDTDQVRNSKKYLNNIKDVLSWLKIDYDGNIIFQSKNHNIYKSVLLQLISEGKAYKCFCDKKRLEELRLSQLSSKSRIAYDGHCRNNIFDPGTSYVIRFKITHAINIEFFDVIRGLIKVDSDEVDDFIIAKNDYSATYNLASVIDDINYNITHIIRGDDHITNTLKQISIIRALNKELPVFVHLPMILDTDGKVLSKRNISSCVDYYINNGFLPEAFLNYIVRLGWSFKDQEIFSIYEMIKLFSLDNISKSPAIVNYKKLVWLNKFYIKNIDYSDFIKHYLPLEKKVKLNYAVGPSIKTLFNVCKHRIDKLLDLATNYTPFYMSETHISCDFIGFIYSGDVIDKISIFYFDLKKQLFTWTLDNIKVYFKNFLNVNGFELADIAFILRIIIFGKNEAFSIYDLLFLCGKILILKKIRHIIIKKGL